MKNKRNILLMLVLLSLTIALSACGSKKLDGDYVGKIKLLFTESAATLRFKGDKVIEIDDEGAEIKEASYKITDNKLEIIYSDDDILTAELSDDKKSFTIKSATGASELFLKDIKFTKKEK